MPIGRAPGLSYERAYDIPASSLPLLTALDPGD